MLNEIQQKFARETCRAAFTHGCKVTINFTKVDGTERTLTALPLKDIPEDKLPNIEHEPAAYSDTILRIFAEVEQDWRSIKIENINTMKVCL